MNKFLLDRTFPTDAMSQVSIAIYMAKKFWGATFIKSRISDLFS